MTSTLLVDGNAIVVRSLWGGVKDEIKLGLPFTSGVYGTLNTLARIIQHHRVRAGRIVAFFDHVPPPSRVRLLPDYKRGRRDHWGADALTRLGLDPDDEPPPDLGVFQSREQYAAAFAQVLQVYRLLPYLGVTTLCYREREADDGLAAAARVLLRSGARPVIVTGDHDLWQTVGWGARVWDLGKARLVDTANFTNHAPCATDTYLLYKALLGDPSDNIRGAHGYGPKRAGELLERANWDVRVVREPRAQLRELCRFLRRQPKRSKAEDALLATRDHLDRVLQAIDLRRSFGPTRGLERRLSERPAVDPAGFLRECRRLGVRTIAPRVLPVFQAAESRRNREKSVPNGKSR